jgi:hypothetical protein
MKRPAGEHPAGLNLRMSSSIMRRTWAAPLTSDKSAAVFRCCFGLDFM